MPVTLGTVAAIGFDEFSPRPWLECFRQLGCSVLQAYRNTQKNISVRQMRDVLAESRMPCDSLHGVFGDEYDPSCPNESGRRFAVDAFKREGELALQLGGPLVVVHSSTIREGGVSADERTLRIRQLRKSVLELGEFGQNIGVRYAFENLPGYHPVGADVAELAGLLKEVGAPATGLCFDTGHAHMVGDCCQALRAAAGQIIYVHFSDNSGTADEHRMPTYGKLDSLAVARCLHDIGYSGTLMLEVFYSVEQLRQLMNEGCAQRLKDLLAIANGR